MASTSGDMVAHPFEVNPHPAVPPELNKAMHKYIADFHNVTGMHIDAHNLPLLHAGTMPLSTAGNYLKKIGSCLEKADVLMNQRKMPDSAEMWGNEAYNLLLPKFYKEFQGWLQNKYKREIKESKYHNFIEEYPDWPPTEEDLKEFRDQHSIIVGDQKKKKKDLSVPFESLPHIQQIKKLKRLKRNIAAEVNDLRDTLDTVEEDLEKAEKDSDKYKKLEIEHAKVEEDIKIKTSYITKLKTQIEDISATKGKRKVSDEDAGEDDEHHSDEEAEEEEPKKKQQPKKKQPKGKKAKTTREETSPAPNVATGNKRLTRAQMAALSMAE